MDAEKIYGVVKEKGPIMPLQIKKEIGDGDSMIIGAHLSQLINNKKIKITHVKQGSSPFYYVLGQEQKLEVLTQYLNEKDRRTYQLLKEKKILRDKTQEMLIRVSCRNIPDYAKQINVNINGVKELFWKHYLLSDEDAVQEIKNFFKKKEDSAPVTSQPSQKNIQEQKKPVVKSETAQETRTAQKSLAEPTDKSEFENKTRKFFEENNIKIIEREMIRKNSEYEFIISMQTPMGGSKYFLKARNKKKCNDGDLSEAYLRGTIKRLPTVFLTTGEVAKKSIDKLETDYKGLMIKKI